MKVRLVIKSRIDYLKVFVKQSLFSLTCLVFDISKAKLIYNLHPKRGVMEKKFHLVQMVFISISMVSEG